MRHNDSNADLDLVGDGIELEMHGIIGGEVEAEPNAPLIPRNDESTSRTSPHTANAFIWTLTLSACLGGLLFGYDTGVISSTLVSINADLSSRELTTLDKSLITSSTSLFALIASPVAGILADRHGRKTVIVIADAFFIIGALWQAISTTVWSMIIGRSLVGVAIGGASMIIPLYIAELVPGYLRGSLVTVMVFFITGGQVVAYAVGWAFSTVSGGWRWMTGLGAFPALTQLALLMFMPDTPRYLARIGREQAAKDVLAKVHHNGEGGSEFLDHVFVQIKEEIQEEEAAEMQLKSGAHSPTRLPLALNSLLFHPPHLRGLTIACLLQGLQQFCGFNVVMYFSATIFSLLGFTSPTLVSLSVAVTNFLFTIVVFNLIDRVGRRRILLWTIPVMVVALCLCAGSFTFIHVQGGSRTHTLEDVEDLPLPTSGLPAFAVLASLVLYVAGYASGLGAVPWQQAELFPLGVRSMGSSLATATNWGANTVVGLTFLPMLELVTPTWTFLSYAMVCLLGWIAVWLIYPETMGLELEDISLLLKDGWGVRDKRRISRDYERFDVSQSAF